MKKTVAQFILLLVALLAVPAYAQDFDKGLAAAERGNYATALQEWRPLAEQGHVEAQFNLGLMYSEGLDVPQDYAEAAKWFRAAAENGNVFAPVLLGRMYWAGLGVPRDYVQAHMWFDLAVAQGRKEADDKREILVQRMTPADVLKAQSMAREWLKAHSQ